MVHMFLNENDNVIDIDCKSRMLLAILRNLQREEKRLIIDQTTRAALED